MSNPMIALLGALIINEELQNLKPTPTMTSQPTTTEPQTTTTSTDPITESTTQTSTSTEPVQTTTQQTTSTNTTTDITTTQPTTQTQLDPTTQTQPQTNTKQQETYPYTCPMCLEEFNSRKELYRIVGCRHLYCQQCVLAYYSQSIKDRKPNVKCPSPSCENQILFCNVKNLLSNDVLLLYQRIALKAPQNQNKSSIWCPGKDCKSKITRQKTNKITDTVVRCQKCKLRVCFKCGEWEHTGVVCDEAEVLTDKKIESENAQKEAFEQWKKDCGVVLKGCPSCGAVIERTTGCSHMTCKACSHQFCFICLASCKATHCR